MKSILFSSILLASCIAMSQNQEHIIRIEFSSLTRGYQEHVAFTRDSMKYSRVQAGRPKVAEARVFKKSEWEDLIKVAQKINLKEIQELKSPTMKRSFDGAKHSTITIITDSNQSYSHLFDDENPHAKLKALMGAIIKKRGK
jgi:hypothetical protein